MKHILERLAESGISTVNVGHKVYTIVTAAKVINDDGAKCWGYTDFENNIIKLQQNGSSQTVRDTLVHEIYHALFETVGLGGAEEDGSLPQLTNEELVVAATRAYMLFVNLNPELARLTIQNE